MRAQLSPGKGPTQGGTLPTSAKTWQRGEKQLKKNSLLARKLQSSAHARKKDEQQNHTRLVGSTLFGHGMIIRRTCLE